MKIEMDINLYRRKSERFIKSMGKQNTNIMKKSIKKREIQGSGYNINGCVLKNVLMGVEQSIE